MELNISHCKWFLLCRNPAVTALPHPVLEDVPICDRCLQITVDSTDFTDFNGPYTMPLILYRLVVDHNEGLDTEDQREVQNVDECWNIPMGDLLCIEGKWNDAMHEGDDPLSIDFTEYGLTSLEHEEMYRADKGVHYINNLMIIKGDNSLNPVFLIFKKA